MTQPMSGHINRALDRNAGRGLLADDDVIPELFAWRLQGQKVALVTLVGIEGGTPRPLGAQMGVAADGRYCGYLSGGCLEKAIALDAQAVIQEGRNRLVRYGRGSPYFDITLPCGSGLDLYIDQSLAEPVLKDMMLCRQTRQAYCLETDLDIGHSQIVRCGANEFPVSRKTASVFRRAYVPSIRLLLIGSGPSVAAIAELASAIGFGLEILSPDEATRDDLHARGFAATGLIQAELPSSSLLDPWTAAIVAFHDHHWEPPLLASILKSNCFYAGALGSRAVHAVRAAKLAELGVSPNGIARLRAPIGMIPGAKDRATLAAGIVAEILLDSKRAGWVP